MRYPPTRGHGPTRPSASARMDDRVKTDRRDAVMLAKLHCAGELTAIWIADTAHEAMRDLVRGCRRGFFDLVVNRISPAISAHSPE